MSTTATEERPEAAERERVWTLEDARETEEAARDVEAKIEELRGRVHALRSQIAEALADGEEPATLKAELREHTELIEDLEGVVPVLRRRADERRRLALRELARERLREVKKKVGGLAGEAPRRAERARELAEKLAAQLEWLAWAPFRRRCLRAEAEYLAEAFHLDVPHLRRIEGGRDGGPTAIVEAVRGRVRAVSGPRDSLSVGLDGETAVDHLARLFDEQSPTPRLIEAVEEPEAAGED